MATKKEPEMMTECNAFLVGALPEDMDKEPLCIYHNWWVEVSSAFGFESELAISLGDACEVFLHQDARKRIRDWYRDAHKSEGHSVYLFEKLYVGDQFVGHLIIILSFRREAC